MAASLLTDVTEMAPFGAPFLVGDRMSQSDGFPSRAALRDASSSFHRRLLSGINLFIGRRGPAEYASVEFPSRKALRVGASQPTSITLTMLVV